VFTRGIRGFRTRFEKTPKRLGWKQRSSGGGGGGGVYRRGNGALAVFVFVRETTAAITNVVKTARGTVSGIVVLLYKRPVPRSRRRTAGARGG